MRIREDDSEKNSVLHSQKHVNSLIVVDVLASQKQTFNRRLSISGQIIEMQVFLPADIDADQPDAIYLYQYLWILVYIQA